MKNEFIEFRDSLFRIKDILYIYCNEKITEKVPETLHSKAYGSEYSIVIIFIYPNQSFRIQFGNKTEMENGYKLLKEKLKIK